jgi:CRISPR-associated protein Cas2
MSWYVACYDISHDGRRAGVARILRDYGRRVQRSVFEVWLDPADLPELRRRVGPLLARADAFDLFPVDARRPEGRIAWQRPPRRPEVLFAGPFPPFDESEGESESGGLRDEVRDGYDTGAGGP